MPLYTKPPKELLLDLIKESNPSLPLPLNASKLSFGIPKAIPLVPGSFANTEILITARGGSGYTKKTTVKYRRLSLETLFRGLSAEVYKYTSANSNQYPFDIYGLLSEINKRFGLYLTQDDVTNAWLPVKDDKYFPDRRTSQTRMRAKPGSLVWVGETNLRWASDRKSIADMILKLELPARSFAGVGRTLTASSKYILNCDTYEANFGDLCPDINTAGAIAVLGSGNAATQAIHQQLITAINTVSKKTYTLTPVGTPFGLGGIKPVRYSLPDPLLPDANSVEFNRVLVIEYPNGDAWGIGKLFLHYNV